MNDDTFCWKKAAYFLQVLNFSLYHVMSKHVMMGLDSLSLVFLKASSVARIAVLAQYSTFQLLILLMPLLFFYDTISTSPTNADSSL